MGWRGRYQTLDTSQHSIPPVALATLTIIFGRQETIVPTTMSKASRSYAFRVDNFAETRYRVGALGSERPSPRARKENSIGTGPQSFSPQMPHQYRLSIMSRTATE